MLRLVKSLAPCFIALILCQMALSQPSRIRYNNQDLFLSGANLAWVSYGSDVGSGTIDTSTFANVMLSMHDHGGNVLRWWLHTEGTVTPQFDDAGYVSGPGTGTIADMRKVLDIAWQRGISVNLCLWSYGMLTTTNSIAIQTRNRNMLIDTNYTRAYINNCLIPMVDSLKGHPAISTWEIFNEPEGMSNEYGWSGVGHVSMAMIQRFINLCAGAIHRADPTALVTNGTWSFKALTDVPVARIQKTGPVAPPLTSAERLQLGTLLKAKNRLAMTPEEIMLHMDKVAATTNFNYYSDSRLVAAGHDSMGTLDFYSVHYYTTIDPSNPSAISPFHHPASSWGLTKPIFVAEFPLQTILGIPKGRLYDTLYQMGYAGAMAWSWFDQNFSTPEDILVSLQYMWDHHRADVKVNGIAGSWPLVSITSPVTGSKFTDTTLVTIAASAADSDGTVVKVEFFVADTLKIGQATSAPYRVDWQNIHPGEYSITAVATDNDGHKRVSNRISIKVGNPPMARLEAEFAAIAGTGITVKSDATASGGKFVDMAAQTGTLTWIVPSVPADGSYDIAFGFKMNNGTPKTQYVNVNGVRQDTVVFVGASASAWYEAPATVHLRQGSDTIQVELWWGYMSFDYLAVPTALVTTSVKVSPAVPASFVLSQNYPNPFNPTTTISYQVPVASLVRLSVYDLLGREVAVLVNEQRTPGTYTVRFSGIGGSVSGGDGRNLASGAYFYRMSAGSFVQTKRMMLVR